MIPDVFIEYTIASTRSSFTHLVGNFSICSWSISVHSIKNTRCRVNLPSCSLSRSTLSFFGVIKFTTSSLSWSARPMICPPLFVSILIACTQYRWYKLYTNSTTFTSFLSSHSNSNASIMNRSSPACAVTTTASESEFVLSENAGSIPI